MIIKKNILFVAAFFSLFISNLYAKSPAYFCGGWYNSDCYYYNLFNQENISQKAFYPFLRTNEYEFYKELKPKETKNLEEWYSFFNGEYAVDELVKVIYGETVNIALLKGNNSKKKAAVTYIKFAKLTEKVAVNNEKYYWDYDKLIKSRKNTAPQVITKGLALYTKEQDKELKLRYGYQLIRLYRYSHQFSKALEFFKNEIQPMQFKNEIYYYILDQIGGCYYKTKQYEKAAYTFLKVFDKSIDKKQSAFISYKFCVYKKAEGKTLLKTSEEKANQIFITALRSFSDTMQDLEKIESLGISEDKQELLAIRIINNFERAILDIDFKKDILHKEGSTNDELRKLQMFISRKIKGTKNLEFWKLTDAYVSFLRENTEEAKQKLQAVQSKKFRKQKENLVILFKVFSWKNVSSENEVWLANLFSKEKQGLNVVGDWRCSTMDSTGKEVNKSLKNIIIDQLSHLYLQEGKIAQSYLLHNQLKDVKKISSHKLVDEITRFVKKEDKNSFETLLLKSSVNNESNKTTEEIILKAKGEVYFRSGDFNTALSYFNSSEEKKISPRIFSNNTMECFDCNDEIVMEDEVFKAEVFSFLNQKMNKYDLLNNLKKLEEMTQDDTLKQWKRKLAYYLLGNYFFNVSNTGYYRTVVYPGNSRWYHYYFGYKQPDISDVIDEKKTYSFPNGGYTNKYNALADKAKMYYNKTIAMSTDNELNARCSYMIAKCELNAFYNREKKEYGKWRWRGYEGDEYTKYSNEGYKALKTKYRGTNFYQRIRSKCSFFRYYDAN